MFYRPIAQVPHRHTSQICKEFTKEFTWYRGPYESGLFQKIQNAEECWEVFFQIPVCTMHNLCCVFRLMLIISSWSQILFLQLSLMWVYFLGNTDKMYNLSWLRVTSVKSVCKIQNWCKVSDFIHRLAHSCMFLLIHVSMYLASQKLSHFVSIVYCCATWAFQSLRAVIAWHAVRNRTPADRRAQT